MVTNLLENRHIHVLPKIESFKINFLKSHKGFRYPTNTVRKRNYETKSCIEWGWGFLIKRYCYAHNSTLLISNFVLLKINFFLLQPSIPVLEILVTEVAVVL